MILFMKKKTIKKTDKGEKNMYDTSDVMKITGFQRDKCRRIIKEVQEKIKSENKNYITLPGKVPIKYFNEYILCINNDSSILKTPE